MAFRECIAHATHAAMHAAMHTAMLVTCDASLTCHILLAGNWYLVELQVTKFKERFQEASHLEGTLYAKTCTALDSGLQSATAQAEAWAEEVQDDLMQKWIQNLSESAEEAQCAPAVRLIDKGVTSVKAVVCLQDVRIMLPCLIKLGEVKLVGIHQNTVPPHKYFLEGKELQVHTLLYNYTYFPDQNGELIERNEWLVAS
eukprot:1160855-Pelagomonas_calceolata.AAC.5